MDKKELTPEELYLLLRSIFNKTFEQGIESHKKYNHIKRENKDTDHELMEALSQDMIRSADISYLIISFYEKSIETFIQHARLRDLSNDNSLMIKFRTIHEKNKKLEL